MSLHLSRKAVAEYLRVSWDSVGRMISRVEKETRSGENRFDNLIKIGIDETSYKKGHKYITVVINHETNSVIWAAKGFGKEVLESFFERLTPAQRKSIQLVSGDGSKWIKDTVADYCPGATFCIDPFHVVSWCEEVLDTVRKQQWNKAREKVAAEKSGQAKRGKGRPKGGFTQKLTIRMAYGFRNIDNLIALIYLRCGGRVIYLPGRAPQKVA